MEKKLIRPLNNKVIAGVCGALGNYFEIDPVIIRIVFVIALFVFFPVTFLAYVILWIVIPQEQPVPGGTPAAIEGNKPENPSTPDEKKKGSGAAVSIFLAIALILAGVLFLVPGSSFWFFDIAAILVAVFLLFIAVKLVYEMVKGKNYHIVSLSIALVAFTYGIFIILNRLNIFGFGIYLEYTKNLIPALLILVGVGIICKNIKNKVPELVIVSALLVFIGVFSAVNGFYSPVGTMGNMMRSFRMPHFGQWFRGGNITTGTFSGSVNIPSGLKSIDYKIESSAGNLNLSSDNEAGTTGFNYTGTGIAPTVTSNFMGGVYQLTFVNQASDTTLKMNVKTPANLNLQVSAGNMNADLTAMDLKALAVNVNGGAVSLKLGDTVKTVSVRNNVGSTDIRVPKNATVRIKVEQSLAHLGIADEFKYVNGVYIYRGGKNEINIDAGVIMGNVEIGF